jgi:hypothetical protein
LSLLFSRVYTASLTVEVLLAEIQNLLLMDLWMIKLAAWKVFKARQERTSCRADLMERDDQLMAVLSELIEVAASRATHQPAREPASP